jgi:MFS family permease
MFLFFGWGCVIWQPIALQYGKRPVYLFSMLANLAIQMWSPYCKTSGPWYANKILQGFFGSPIESLREFSGGPVLSHEKGKYMELYALFLLGSNILAPLFSGFIYNGMGWKWVLYWPAIGCGFGFLMLFFLMEETNYYRKIIGVVESMESSASSTNDSANNPEKGAKTPASTATNIETGPVYTRKTFFQKLSLVDRSRPNKLLTMMWRPFTFLSLQLLFTRVRTKKNLFPLLQNIKPSFRNTPGPANTDLTVPLGFAYGCTVVWGSTYKWKEPPPSFSHPHHTISKLQLLDYFPWRVCWAALLGMSNHFL